MLGLGGDRAPGTDGFPIEFFEHFWDLIKSELCQIFKEFHANGRIPQELSASFIAFIQKKEL